MGLCLRFHESEIGYWASRYLDIHSLKEQENEIRLIGLKDRIQQNGEMTKAELYDIQTWKATQGLFHLKPHSDDLIRKTTQAAFEEKDDWDKLKILMDLKGIFYPRASVILHFYDSGDFPIVDRYADYAIDRRSPYSKEFWLEYVRLCQDMASRNGFNMRTIDRALWTFGWYHGEA